jgi:uncharacterized protein (DUF302 family)
MTYAITATIARPFAEAVTDTRQALADVGFGVLTEIDLQQTLKAKLQVEVLPQVILGACRPPLAYAALQAEPSGGVLLPCTVVVRAVDGATTVVEAMDPHVMVALTGNDGLTAVAADARARLTSAMESLRAP